MDNSICTQNYPKKKPGINSELLCDPGGIQTHDLQNRNLTFYSAELRDQLELKFIKIIHSSISHLLNKLHKAYINHLKHLIPKF